MPNLLQRLQQPGLVLVGVMTLVALIVLLLSIVRLVRKAAALKGLDRDALEVIYVCIGSLAAGTVSLTVFAVCVSQVPQTTGLNSWFALVSVGVAVVALFFVYLAWDNKVINMAINMSLLGLTAMSYLALACEFWLIDRQYDTSHWTGFVRRFPVAPLWLAAALIVLTVVLLAASWYSFIRTSPRKPRPPASKPTPPEG